MASIVLPYDVWTGIPIAASAGNVSVHNPSLDRPVYFRVVVAAVQVSLFKAQPAGDVIVAFPAGALLQAMPCADITVTTTVL